MNIRLLGCLLLGFGCISAGAYAEPPDYSKQIQPLLNKYCTGCHNDADREGKLSLETHASLLKGGSKGAAITPGRGDQSRLIRMLTGKAEPAMPPKDNEKPSAADIALLTAWIDAGAKGPTGTLPDPTQLATPKIPLKAPLRQFISSVAISPQGDRIALARYGEVEIQSLPERKTLHKLAGLLGSVNGVAFSEDGALLVAAAGEPGILGQAIVWKTADGAVVREFRGHKDNLYCARFSPDGKLLATGGYDHQIKLWNLETGKEVKTLEGHNGPVFELAFRPDGKVLASCSGDRTVKLWSVPAGERLETLKESTKELYALAFSPDGKRVAAAGVDNRIRIWEVSADGKEGTNPLQLSQFAHEQAVLRIAWSKDGRTLVSTGEERLIKVWNAAETMSIRETLDKQPDWVSGLAVSADGSQAVAGRLDGSVTVYATKPLALAGNETPLIPLPETPAEMDYGPQPPLDKLPAVAEVEPNDEPSQALPLSLPGTATGRIFVADQSDARDQDLFRIEAKKGEQWIFETDAARSKSPLDSRLEILDAAGKPVPRLLLRAIRDLEIEFRGMNGDQRGVRLKNWEELLLNEYVYLSGEVIKHYQQRRGPDGEGNFYPETGSRFAFFETTSRAHALGEPGYVVVPYAVGTQLPDNGLPVFTQYFENDDDSLRKLGKDSRVTFVAPEDGTYLIRVSDVRGFAGENYTYKLVARRPVPDFSVKLNGENLALNPGSGKAFSVKADRVDGFMGPITVEISGVPAGYQATTPLVIPAGLYEAHGVISALPNIAPPSEEQCKAIKVTATANVAGKEVTREVNNFGTIKFAEKKKEKPEDPAMLAAAKVIVHLERSDTPSPAVAGAAKDAAPSAEQAFPKPPEITIAPGGTVTCRLRIERRDFADRVQFDVTNLPHGIIVDDIGLNGILIVEGQTERTIFLRAEPWVPEQTRTFQAIAQVDGNQVSLPMVIHVKK